MALSTDEIANILFKKIAANKATTDISRFYGNNEEPYTSFQQVLLSQIFAESNLIPQTASVVPNVVSFINKLQLINVPGSLAFTHPTLKNVIPFDYDVSGGSYAYTIYASDAQTIIPPGENDWYLDSNGILTFFTGLPSGVSTGAGEGPFISCYIYVGKTLDQINLGSSSTMINTSQWQNSVISLVETLPSNNSYLDRYIFNSTSSVVAPIYNSVQDIVTSGTILPNSIVEWHITENSTGGIGGLGTTAGWYNIPATNGMFTSVDSDSNNIYFYNPSIGWSKYSGEKTYPTDLQLIPQDTFTQASDEYPHIISNTTIALAGTPNTEFYLYVNGIKINENDFALVPLTSRSLTYVSSGTNSVSFTNVNATSSGDALLINSNIWRIVDTIVSDTIYFQGTSIPSIVNAQVYSIGASHLFPQIGDYIIINPSLGYDIEGVDTGEPDSISFTYVRPNP